MSSTDFVVVHGTLVSYIGNAEEVIIPEGVVKIGSDAFKSNNSLRVVSFNGNTLKSIESEAFAQCCCLERVVLPEGLIQICSHAFFECDSLLYVYIPASVMVIGEEAIVTKNKKFFILGKAESEADRYAKDRKFTFKTDIDRTINALNSYGTTKAKVRTATFDIFGEKITCSNTLATYHAVLEYYAERKDIVFEEFINTLPTTVTEGVKGNPAAVLEREQTNTLTRLDNYGIISGELSITCNLALAQAAELILKATQAIIKAYNAVCNSTRESIDDNYQQLIREAESRVTGLSYGRIGSSFDMVLYAIDDYRAKQRQRKEAYAIADKKADEYRTHAISEAEKAYTEMLQKVAPLLRQGTDMYVEALCNAEIQKLTEEGLIDAATLQSIDIAKSTELINSIMNARGDNSFVLGLALQKYPCNIAALVYAIEHGYRCDGIKELISFLGFGNKISEILKKNQEVRYIKFIEKAKEIAATNPNKFAALLKQRGSYIKDSDMAVLIAICGKTISDGIDAIDIHINKSTDEQVKAFCITELDKVIIRSSWDIICTYGNPPIKKIQGKITHVDIYKYIYQKATNYQAELINQEKRKEQAKRFILVAALGLLVIVSCLFAYFGIIIPHKTYNDANALMAVGKFPEAVSLFEELDGYKDSVDKIKACKYSYALELIDKGNYVEAYEMLILLDEYEDSREKAHSILDEYHDTYISNVSVNDVVYLGKYNGNTLSWTVVTTEENHAILVCNSIIASMPYNEKTGGIDPKDSSYHYNEWPQCSLRIWLNDEFLNTAFSNSEKNLLVSASVPSAGEHKDEGIASDYVYILSHREMEQALKTNWDSARTIRSNALWVRGSAGTNGQYAQVYNTGIDYGNVITSVYGVVPVIWVRTQ